MAHHNTGVPPHPEFTNNFQRQIAMRERIRGKGIPEEVYLKLDRDPGRYLETKRPDPRASAGKPRARYLACPHEALTCVLITCVTHLCLARPHLRWLLQSALTMASIGHLIPRQCVPNLSLRLAGGGSWRLSDQKPKHFTMLAFYRGMPFGRSCLDDILRGIAKVVARDYPARGEVVDLQGASSVEETK